MVTPTEAAADEICAQLSGSIGIPRASRAWRVASSNSPGSSTGASGSTGADDFVHEESTYEIYTSPNAFDSVLNALKEKNIQTTSAEISMIPQTHVKVEGKAAQQVIKLMEALDEHDDVQHVYGNFDIEESELEAAVS